MDRRFSCSCMSETLWQCVSECHDCQIDTEHMSHSNLHCHVFICHLSALQLGCKSHKPVMLHTYVKQNIQLMDILNENKLCCVPRHKSVCGSYRETKPALWAAFHTLNSFPNTYWRFKLCIWITGKLSILSKTFKVLWTRKRQTKIC